jgi:hypothetical protein
MNSVEDKFFFFIFIYPSPPVSSLSTLSLLVTTRAPMCVYINVYFISKLFSYYHLSFVCPHDDPNMSSVTLTITATECNRCVLYLLLLECIVFFCISTLRPNDTRHDSRTYSFVISLRFKF